MTTTRGRSAFLSAHPAIRTIRLVWRPRGGAQVRVRFGRYRGATGTIRKIRSRWGAVTIELDRAYEFGGTREVTTSALWLAPVGARRP